VIASFVLGLGDQQETAPNASINFDYDEGSGTLTVTKSGGDTIEGENLYIRGANPDPAGLGIDPSYDVSDMITSGGNSITEITGVSSYTTGDIGAGQGFEIDMSSGSDNGAAYEITLVYEDGDTSEELQSDSGPDA